MGGKGDYPTEQAAFLGFLMQIFQQVAMPDMNAVEDASGKERFSIGNYVD